MNGGTLDPDYVHKAHTTSLTTMWLPDAGGVPRPHGDTVSAFCTGRVGWDWTRKNSHHGVELYRGQDWDQAQRACDEHNAAVHREVLDGAQS